MSCRLLSLVCCVAVALTADEAGPPAVSLVGVRVIRALTAGDGQVLLPFGWNQGLGLCLAVWPAGGGIVRLDPASAGPALLVDDRGTNLLEDPTTEEPVTVRVAGIASDAGCMLIEIIAPRCPAMDATTVRVTGTVRVAIAAEQAEEHRAVDVRLATGTSFALGDVTFTVDTVAPSDAVDGMIEVAISRPADGTVVDRLRFLRPDGTETAVESFVQVGGPTDRAVVVHLFRQLPDPVTVAATCRRIGAVRDLPYDLTAGLGLGLPAPSTNHRQ